MVSDATRKASKGSLIAKVKPACNVICGIVVVLLSLWIVYNLKVMYENRGVGQGTLVSNKCWVPQGRRTCAPQFIIAGAMKSGTTSLWSYLQSHPHVLSLASFVFDPQNLRSVTAEKEVRFFNDPGYTTLVNAYGKAQAINYYLDLFPIIPPPNAKSRDLMLMTNQNRITGEATPMYISSLGVAPRVKEALPHVKIIILLRNPIDRAYSDYWFRKNLKITSEKKENRFAVENYSHSEVFDKCVRAELRIADYCGFSEWAENPTITDAAGFWHCAKKLARQVVSANETSHICSPTSKLRSLCLDKEVQKNCQSMGMLYGLYAPQLIEWVEFFDKENLFIVPSEKMFSYPANFMEDVANYLDLDTFNWESVTQNTFNIINPKSVKGSQLELATSNTQGLQIGKSDTTSEYPPLDPTIRENLTTLLAPYNLALSSLLGDVSFLEWNNINKE